jgi:SAM-dependent methyltransferase
MGSTDSLELWEGKFGSDYHGRNPEHVPERAGFWDHICSTLGVSRVLEVGCGTGINLHHLLRHADAWGVEVNEDALGISKANLPEAHIVYGDLRDLPFKDDFFDLTFTAGVLIHQDPKLVGEAMDEIIRCSSDNVLSIEYEAEKFESIPYRGEVDALYKGPYSRLYREKGLEFIEGGELFKEDGFDDCSWSLFEM